MVEPDNGKLKLSDEQQFKESLKGPEVSRDREEPRCGTCLRLTPKVIKTCQIQRGTRYSVFPKADILLETGRFYKLRANQGREIPKVGGC
ncbi:hypothetical protein J6590_062559 [Homalodisca vitripennis]|nr:hypothetical protein J6590_062559 [Homalodisca vitripennis]